MATNRSGGNAPNMNPFREVDPLTVRVLSAMGEEIGYNLFSKTAFTADKLIEMVLVTGGSMIALSDVKRESLQGVLRGTVPRLMDLWRKRKDKTDMNQQQVGEWAAKSLVDDYAKSLEHGEKNPTLLMALGQLSIGEHHMLSEFLRSSHLLNSKDLEGIAPGSPEEKKKIADTRAKIIEKGDKIILPMVALRGALWEGDDELRHQYLRKLIHLPEESGTLVFIKKQTGLDLAHPEKLLHNLNVDGVAENLNAKADESAWRMAIYERNKIERAKNRPSFIRSVVNGFTRSVNWIKSRWNDPKLFVNDLKQLMGW